MLKSCSTPRELISSECLTSIESSNWSKNLNVLRSNCDNTLTTTPLLAAEFTSSMAGERHKCRIPNLPKNNINCSSASLESSPILFWMYSRPFKTANFASLSPPDLPVSRASSFAPDIILSNALVVLSILDFWSFINLLKSTGNEEQENFIGLSAVTLTNPI